MERALLIKNYRNVGFGKSEKLVLNYSLQKGQIGNLVIIIGANNSGKSNILDALQTFYSNDFNKQDRTTLDFGENYSIQKLALSAKDDDGNTYEYEIGSDKKTSVSIPNDKKEIKFTKTNLKSTVDALQNVFNAYSIRSYSDTSYRYLLDCTNNFNTLTEKEILEKLVASLNNLIKLKNSYSNVNDAYNQIKNLSSNNEGIAYLLNSKGTDTKASIQSKYLHKYKIEFFPEILRYNNTPISTSDLSTSPSGLSNNKFFKNLLVATQSNVDEIINAYKSLKETKNRGILTQVEKKFNKNLLKIEKDFNRVYFLSNDKYSFKLTLETDGVFFEIFRDDVSLNLDYQSTGFKWFFNLYFNMLCGNPLKSGDVLIMDEPATNLHVQGQKELREFLKAFAIKNDITIVLATHSPFLIDINYLDELRVIYTKDSKCYINNDFSAFDPNDADSLKPIKEALTVHNHILLNPDKKVIFVEGITDYNYMTAFAKMLAYDDIVFLPIKGVGDKADKNIKEYQKNIIKSLLSIRKSNALLMVDGDSAGKSMEASCKDTALRAFNLSSVDANFKTIESLFSKDDLVKFSLTTKHAGTSALLKTFSSKTDFSQETLDNFKKLFDFIENI